MTEEDKKARRPHIIVANSLFGHPRFIPLTDRAKITLIELWAWSNEYKTDGRVPTAHMRSKGPTTVKQLTDHGWAEQDGDHYQLTGYLRWQWSAEEQEKHKNEKARAGAKGGKKGGAKGMHNRWHVARGISSPDCEICAAEHTG